MTKNDWVVLGLSVLTVVVAVTPTVIIYKKYIKKIPVFPLWDFKKVKEEETNNNK